MILQWLKSWFSKPKPTKKELLQKEFDERFGTYITRGSCNNLSHCDECNNQTSLELTKDLKKKLADDMVKYLRDNGEPAVRVMLENGDQLPIEQARELIKKMIKDMPNVQRFNL